MLQNFPRKTAIGSSGATPALFIGYTSLSSITSRSAVQRASFPAKSMRA
jgi:hypothetical protein